MANIFQKMFLTRTECKLIDAIKKSNIHMKRDDDVMNMFTTTSFRINNGKLNIVATHQWHHAQGDNYTLVVHAGPEYDLRKISRHRFERIHDRLARRTFMRMQKKYNQHVK